MIGENGKESNGDQTNSKQKSNGDQTNTKQILNYVSQLSGNTRNKGYLFIPSKFPICISHRPYSLPLSIKSTIEQPWLILPFTTEVQYNLNVTTMGNHLHIMIDISSLR